MAYTPRSINDIFQELLTEKETFATLSGLIGSDITDENTLILAMNNGKAPEWVLWLYNMAVATHITEVAAKTSVDEITSIVTNSKVPVAQWYITKALEFQYGDVVEVNPLTYAVAYPTLDESKQIIGAVTTLDSQNCLTLKVRKKDYSLMTADELSSFTAYMQRVKAAGTQIAIENYDGDLFTFNMDIVYDGNYGISLIKSSVEQAITDYLLNLGTSSKFLTNELVNRLQAIKGVIDPRMIESKVVNAVGVMVAFNYEYLTGAGWGQINPSTPLSTTLNYIAQ